MRRKRREITSKEVLERVVEPSPTERIEKTRKGLSVRKSKTKATTKVDVAASKE